MRKMLGTRVFNLYIQLESKCSNHSDHGQITARLFVYHVLLNRIAACIYTGFTRE
jgi:hypothetical protein